MTSMPFSEDSEKGLLCSIAMRPSILDEAQISDSLFYIPAHQLIFRRFVEVYTDKNTLDFIVVKATFKLSELSEIGGVEMLSEIYGFVPAAANWRYYHEILVDKHVRRTTIQAVLVLHQKMLDDSPGQTAAEVREIAERGLLSLITQSQRMKEAFLPEHVAQRMDEAVGAEGPSNYIEASDIRALNLALGGLLPGDQVVIAAETSFGKTTLAVNIATHIALGSQKKKVAVFSFEMNIPDLTRRIMASCADVPLQALRYRTMTPEQLQKLDKWRATLPNERTINLVEGYALDVTEIISRCRHMKATGQLDMVIVDYLQLVNPAITREANRQREVADISRRLKVMAGELGVVVIALSQLNDAGKLRESRAIGQDADVVLLIEEGKSDDAFEKIIRIEKSRNGPSGKKVPVHFFGDYVKFTDKS